MSGVRARLSTMSRGQIEQLASWCQEHRIHPICALLLMDFAETSEGRRFVAGGQLAPQWGGGNA